MQLVVSVFNFCDHWSVKPLLAQDPTYVLVSHVPSALRLECVPSYLAPMPYPFCGLPAGRSHGCYWWRLINASAQSVIAPDHSPTMTHLSWPPPHDRAFA